MVDEYDDKILLKEMQYDLSKFDEVSMTKFDAFQEERYAGIWKQFNAIYVRNWRYLMRNPKTYKGTFFNGVFNGLLCLSLYWGAADLN